MPNDESYTTLEARDTKVAWEVATRSLWNARYLGLSGLSGYMEFVLLDANLDFFVTLNKRFPLAFPAADNVIINLRKRTMDDQLFRLDKTHDSRRQNVTHQQHEKKNFAAFFGSKFYE